MMKTAFVTGGASGIGAATCRLFVENGYHVYIGDIQEDAGISLAKELRNATFINVNVRIEKEIEAAKSKIVQTPMEKKKNKHSKEQVL